MTRFASAFISSIDGTSSDISTKELCGGARIYYIFNSVFGNSMGAIDPTSNLSVMDIRTAIRNSTGPRPSLFVPELAFDLLVKPQIRLLESPAHRCVELVYEELIKICHTCGNTELSRFPRLQAKLIEVVSDLLRERLGPCSQYVESLIAIQRAYVNTNHPNFLGAAGAMSSVMSSKQEKERREAQLERRQRRKGAMAASVAGSVINGGEPEFEEPPQEVMGHSRVHSRSLSPVTGHAEAPSIASAMNGRPNSPHVFGSKEPKPTDSFLNYFFGKDGPGNPSMNVPVRPSTEPSFGQNARRMNPTPRDIPFDARSSIGIVEDEPAPVWKPLIYLFTNANIHQAPQDPTEPALTEREQMETELIRRLITSYFNIVREIINDQVPKAIMHLLVNHSKDAVQNRLVTELYREEYFNDLLYEDDNIKAEREKCERLLETYRQAARIVNDVV